jgi:hypothetical protein
MPHHAIFVVPQLGVLLWHSEVEYKETKVRRYTNKPCDLNFYLWSEINCKSMVSDAVGSKCSHLVLFCAVSCVYTQQHPHAHSHPEGIKPEIRVHKVRSGTIWEGVLNKKGVKQVGVCLGQMQNTCTVSYKVPVISV